MPTSRTKKAGQKQSGKRSSNTNLEYEQKYKVTKAMVDQFADTHPEFDKVAGLMTAIIKRGFDLDQAYNLARFFAKKGIGMKVTVK